MSYKKFQELYQRCTSGNCTREEQILFEEYKDNFELTETPWLPEYGNKAEIEKKLRADLNNRLPKRRILRLNFTQWAAAAVILVLTIGVAFFAAKHFSVNNPTSYTANVDKNIIKPGNAKAVITFADGSKFTLNESRKGRLFTIQHVSAENNITGIVTYHKVKPASFRSTPIYNVMSTPRGGKYQLVLEDGTKVWLNAASTIKYPLTFTGNTREVELAGEAYFEVAHDARRPFKVVSGGQIVQVLGTHFNVNAYTDEKAVKTTLLEGRVGIYQKNNSATVVPLIIAPNEQAIFKDNQLSKIVVDAQSFTTWTSGRIVFKDADLQDVMQKISRWYDVDVIYEGKIGNDTYNGEIPQNAAFSKVLEMLKLDDIHVKVSGRKLIVSQ